MSERQEAGPFGSTWRVSTQPGATIEFRHEGPMTHPDEGWWIRMSAAGEARQQGGKTFAITANCWTKLVPNTLKGLEQ